MSAFTTVIVRISKTNTKSLTVGKRSFAIVCDYMETGLFAIVCDRLRSYGNQPFEDAPDMS